MKEKLVSSGLILAFLIYPGLLPAQNLRLDYSTYLGGSNTDSGSSIALDTENCAYVTGYTKSSDFPTRDAYQSSHGGSHYDVFISKFSSSGTALLYSTYLGGDSDEEGRGIAVDAASQAYVTGCTRSWNFPTVDPYQPTVSTAYDAFVSKLSSSGSSLIYSTYLGGNFYDQGYDIALDSGYRLYVTGYTSSSDFPTKNPYQSSKSGGYDAFVTKFSSTGTSLIYSTFLGGTQRDHGYSIAVGTNGHASVTGETVSLDFPTVNPYQSSWNEGSEGGGPARDVFVTRLSSSGSAVLYSTYLGGKGGDVGYGICLDSAHRAYVTGWTSSTGFPLREQYQSYYGGEGDAFITCFSSSGASLEYSTFLGGSEIDNGRGLAVGPDGGTYVTGYTYSDDFPTENSFQASRAGDYDAFVTRFSSSGTSLVYSTYLGGSGHEENYEKGPGICLDAQGRAYVTGQTYSTDFPIWHQYQSTNAGSGDAFVCKLVLGGAFRPYVPGDFNGDGTSDIAIFRPSSGLWAVRSITRVYFGNTLDQAVPADYDGDATTDIAVFRDSSGLWAVRGVTRAYFGTVYDLPRPGDYDGDGVADIGLFRDNTGLWAIKDVTRVYFGQLNDIPSPGYFDGDNILDIALFRPSSGLWAMRGVSRLYFGGSADSPRPGDYDGNGTFEAGIFRPATGLWAIRGLTREYFGGSTDSPVPADYNGDGADRIGIFRPSSGLWAVRGTTRIYYGSPGDIPVTR